jgi:hypothetical protein
LLADIGDQVHRQPPSPSPAAAAGSAKLSCTSRQVVDQILFERQVAQPPLPLDPEILEVLPY